MLTTHKLRFDIDKVFLTIRDKSTLFFQAAHLSASAARSRGDRSSDYAYVEHKVNIVISVIIIIIIVIIVIIIIVAPPA